MTKDILFNDVVEMWLSSIEYVYKESTYFKYYHLYQNHIEPYFKDIKASNINSEDLVKFLSYLKKEGRKDGKGGLSGSLCSIKSLLQLSIDYGADKGYMNHIYFKYRIHQSKYDEIEVLEENEVKILEEYIYKNMNLTNLGILICLYTGLRIGEICALQWKDISIEQSYLIINKTVQRLPINKETTKTQLKINTPKSRTSLRKVPLPAFLCKYLKRYQNEPNIYILSNSLKPLDPRTYQNRFKSLLKKVKIRYVNFHALRHTFATRCIHVGIDVKTVSEILGHSNVQVTMSYYVYSSFEFKKQQIERLCINKYA